MNLDAPVPVTLDDDTVTTTFSVEEGRRLAFVLSYSSLMDTASSPESVAGDDARVDPEAALADTRRHWRGWIGRFDEAKTRWPKPVKRSL